MASEILKEVSEKMKASRIKNKTSQAKYAKKLGISQETWSKYERRAIRSGCAVIVERILKFLDEIEGESESARQGPRQEKDPGTDLAPAPTGKTVLPGKKYGLID